jgi:NADH-quinone oxidoreductase subunit H
MDEAQNRVSWIDIIAFSVAALLPLFLIAALWYDGYPAISYITDVQPPEDFDFRMGLTMWLLPLSILGTLTFTYWGLLDKYATQFTSRWAAGFAGLGLLYFLLVILNLGFGAIGQFEAFRPLPFGEAINDFTTINGGQAFLPMLFILLFLVIQGFLPRDFAPEDRPGEVPKAFGVPLPIFIPVFFVGNAVLFFLLANWGAVLNASGSVLEFAFNRDNRADEVILCSESNGCAFLHPIFYSAILLFVVITGFAYTTLLERKFIAWFQQRVGPNRVGPGGLLQPAADGLKLLFKENIKPSQADTGIYRIAPMLKAIPTLVVLAAIPIGPDIVVPWFDGNWYQVPLVLIDTGVGILWLLAITSIGTYGVVLAGWASNNKYSMLGGMRAASQMVSYELSMGITLAVPVLIAGTMSITGIVDDQGGLFINWYVFQNPLAAIVLLIALVAETNRAPFDLPEAEQELTAGYMTEYSGMKFALFMMAEYLGMIAVSMIAASVFFGGYNDGFGLVDAIPILGPLVMIGKVVLFLIGFVWLRATLPRLRYDRLMMFGWKVMLPLALISVVFTSVAVIVGEEFGEFTYAVVSGLMFVAILGASVFFLGRPEEDDAVEEYETDPVITGERDGLAWGGVMLLGGLAAIPFAIYAVTAPLVVFLWRLVTVPILALFNVGENRDRFRRGLLIAIEPLANLGEPEDDQEPTDAPRLESGD